MAFAADEVRAELERVVSGPALAGSVRLRRFLTYIVERTLAGESGQLKEYAIGVDVFDRDDQYDPRIDSIVRVEAGRLRGKLEEHYKGAGAADPIVISIPRGSYVPVFDGRQPTAPPARTVIAAATPRPWLALAPLVGVLILTVLLGGFAALSRRPQPPGDVPLPPAGLPGRISIAVLPFDHYSNDPADALLAERVTDEVTSGLARDGRVDVVSRTTARQFEGARRSLADIARELGADVIIEGSVTTAGEDVRVRTRFVNGLRDRKTGVLEFAGTRPDLDDLLRRVIQGVSDAAPTAIRPAL
jgi:adenylate cyclase